jgi:hypothetical protein
MDMDNLCSALCRMSANFMRVTRGGGAPEGIIAQAKDIVLVYEALKAEGVIKGGSDDATLDVYFSKALNGYVGSDADVVRAMKGALDINRKPAPKAPVDPYNRRVEHMVAGALRIAAARQLGDHLQENAGERDLTSSLPAGWAAG